MVIVVVNAILTVWNSYKWQREPIHLCKQLLGIIQDIGQINDWGPNSYTDMNTPLSPCISLQWTERDSRVVNLPQPLLVQGDIIHLRPGHVVPARCEELEPDSGCSPSILGMGDTYIPVQTSEVRASETGASGPQARAPHKPKPFVCLETPILQNFRLVLTRKIERPPSVLTNECHRVVYVWMTQLLLPACVLLMLIINALRFIYLPESAGDWTEMFFVSPVNAVLPLIPLTFPLMWITINCYGQARILAAYHVAKELRVWPLGSISSFGSCSTISVEEARVDMDWKTILSSFWAVFRGRADFACSNFDLLHVLGNVTSLCCIDKKGILSWANPSAEKVFFFSSAVKECPKLDLSHTGEGKELTSANSSSKIHEPKRKRLKKISRSDVPGHVEVLDLTHDAKDAFKVFFDDPEWNRHLDCLKALGVGILLNTCSQSTADWYTQFCDHVGCIALQKEETVAVVNRRCLCQVAKQIGFTSNAVQSFNLEKMFGIYREVPLEEMEREKQQRAKSFLYHKIPMPNFSSVIVRDKTSGMFQLLTQGTADIVLDCCIDYWDGTALCTLTDVDRKRILDFYHRNSMAAYCTAFSYKPVLHSIASNVDATYIELVGMPSQLLQKCLELDALSGDGSGGLARSFSVSSLVEDESFETVDDVASYYGAQRNQTFIGMTTLQYQARQDFVQLIEKLESACVRFVHFSKENELRSRVFSEKMGLEAGWNCHISLLNETGTCSEGIASGSGSFVQGRKSADSTQSQDHQPKELKLLAEDSLALRSQSAPCMILAYDDEGQRVKFNVEPQQDSFQVDFGCGDRVRRTSEQSEGARSRKLSFSTAHKPERSAVQVEKEAEDEGGGGTECLDTDFADNHRLLSASASSLCSTSSAASSEGELEPDSRYTSSYVTEYTDDSLTGALDNRAQLPRGIGQIRPHLEKVDNVPLLVNLFTDCTPPTTVEMFKILQENGEVVLCIGSSLNMVDTAIFLQADCSLAIEPPYPQLCACKMAVGNRWNKASPSPTELASRLLALPCSLAYQREDNVSILQLIAEARHHTTSLRSCFYLLLCCQLCIVLASILAAILLLPPPLPPAHLLWLLLVALPLLSAGLMGNPVDPKIMMFITNKNKDHVSQQLVIQFLMQFSLRFVPSILMALLCYGLTLHSFCHNTAPVGCSLFVLSEARNMTYTNWDEKFSGGLVLAQNIFHLYTLLFFVVISMSLVHWLDHIWSQVPFTNRLWSALAALLVMIQVVLSVVDVSVRNRHTLHPMPLSHVHPAVWVLMCIWPALIIVLNELVKCLEIRFFRQHQRRARLDFGTKLGMNSPF